jgi:hypothetical protein
MAEDIQEQALPIASPPRVWIEDTKSWEHGHGGPGWEFGTCLWSPSSDSRGADYYSLMREPEPGDLVIHIDNSEFVGWSYVAAPFRELENTPPSPGRWAGRPSYYRIDLSGYHEFPKKVQRADFIKKYNTVIREELDKGRPSGYPFVLRKGKEIRYGQGTYLGRCTPKLYELIRNHVFGGLLESVSPEPSPLTTRRSVKMAPTNLILYGPPGTGKTYITMERAVSLCDGSLPQGSREAVMTRYRELVARKRIAFVTFHQSYAYEDFVEGLRPETSGGDNSNEGSSGGFSLRSRPGVFRQIADLARDNRGQPGAAFSFNRSRQVFKMSLGRSAEEEDAPIFREAVNGGYVILAGVAKSTGPHLNTPPLRPSRRVGSKTTLRRRARIPISSNCMRYVQV